MGISAAHASTFYKQVAKNKKLWTIKDEGGFIAPMTPSGKRAQPFWSSLSRAEKMISDSKTYSSFEPYEISWDDFRDKWLMALEKDGILIGINWSGTRALGYDLEPKTVRKAIEIQITHLNNDS